MANLGSWASDCKTGVDQSPVAIISVVAPFAPRAWALHVHKYFAVPAGTVCDQLSKLPLNTPVAKVNVVLLSITAGALFVVVLLLAHYILLYIIWII